MTAPNADPLAPDPADIDAGDIDLSDVAMWSRAGVEREAIFAKLRADRPMSFHPEPDYGTDAIPTGPGYWAVVRYADVMEASRAPDRFISGQGTNIPDFPPEVNELFGSMINMDAPRHTKLRLIVNRGFTPRMVARIEDGVRARAASIVDAIAPNGECDFVTEVAAALPLQIICDMMGIPESDYQWVFDQTNKVLGGGDPEYGGSIESAFAAGAELWQYAQELGQRRLDDPGDDITTALMQAEVEGERLTAQELGSFFVLLVVAGNETTRNAISHGLLALTQHPDQRARLRSDLAAGGAEGVLDTAVAEIVRWATPVIHFRRTATQDTTLGGEAIKAGDKIVLFYN
ncbi:cytochrome P450 [soil metagenome]